MLVHQPVVIERDALAAGGADHRLELGAVLHWTHESAALAGNPLSDQASGTQLTALKGFGVRVNMKEQ